LSQQRLKQSLIDWLSKQQLRMFLTVTLKKSLVDKNTRIHVQLTDEEIVRTGKYLQNQITRLLTGRRGRLSISTFREIGRFDRRPHLHILFDNPNDIPIDRMEKLLRPIIEENRWTHDQWDVRPITTQRALTGYSLKQGIFSFLPEASSRPSEDIRTGQ
jgi:hypothetical protein